jgi:hypothetical protein
MIIYHRADLDGLCSGAIALKYANGKFGGTLGLDYHDPVPSLEDLGEGPHCIMDIVDIYRLLTSV